MLLISSALFIVYFLTQSRYIFGGDSAEFFLVSKIGGIAHPPGYEFYSFIQHFLYKTLGFLPVYIRVNLFSIICTTITSYVLFRLLKLLTKNTFISAISSFFYSTLYLVWLYTIVPEVYAFHIFLIALTTYFVCDYSNKPTLSKKYFICLLCGIGLTHHQSFILFVPGWIYLLWSKKKNFIMNEWLKTSFFFLLGCLPLLYAPIISFRHHPLDWENAKTIIGFFRLTTRASYGTFSAFSGSIPNIFNQLANIISIVIFFIKDYKPAGLFFIILGFVYLSKHLHKIFTYVSINAFFYVIFIFLTNFTLYTSFIVGVFERYLIGFYFIMIIPFAFGVLFFLNFFDSFIKNKVFVPIVKKGILLYIIMFISLSFFQNYRKISVLKNIRSFEYLGKDILNTPQKKNTIFSLTSDLSFFSTLYFYYGEEYRRYLKFVFLGIMDRSFYRDRVKKTYSSLNVEKNNRQYSLLFFLENNVKENDIFLETPQKIGYWVPCGLMWKYYKTYTDLINDMPNMKKWNRYLWTSVYHLPYLSSKQLDLLLVDGLQNQYLSQIENLIAFYISQKDYEEAMFYITKGLSIRLDYEPIQKDLVKLMAEKNECQNIQKKFGAISPQFTKGIMKEKLLHLQKNYCNR